MSTKRFLAPIVFGLAGVFLLLCVAGGIGVWVVRGPATAKATKLFARIDEALNLGDEGLEYVKTNLTAAADRLETGKAEQRRIASEPMAGQAARRIMARTVQQRIAPDLHNAHEKLHTVAQAAVVVNAMLEDVGNFPFLSVLGV